MIVGACAGSTSGGLKLMRIRIGVKVAFRELARIAQPRKIHMIRMNKEVVEDKQVSLVVGMLFIWVLLFGFSCIVLALMMPDASFETIFSVAASGLGNTGPALGDYGPTSTWAGMNSGSLVFTSILMWRKEEKADGERQGMAMVKRILDREDSEDQNNVI
jgi:trk system potassium uptake protein TrkH